MTTNRSPRLDCLTPALAPDGPQDAPSACAEAGVGGRQKVARRASFQLFPPIRRTSCTTRSSERRDAA